MSELTMDKLVSLCKGRGFVYPGSEIYGGLANTWDYGPLGMTLKNNIKAAWLKKFVQEELGLGLISHPEELFNKSSVDVSWVYLREDDIVSLGVKSLF